MNEQDQFITITVGTLFGYNYSEKGMVISTDNFGSVSAIFDNQQKVTPFIGGTLDKEAAIFIRDFLIKAIVLDDELKSKVDKDAEEG